MMEKQKRYHHERGVKPKTRTGVDYLHYSHIVIVQNFAMRYSCSDLKPT